MSMRVGFVEYEYRISNKEYRIMKLYDPFVSKSDACCKYRHQLVAFVDQAKACLFSAFSAFSAVN